MPVAQHRALVFAAPRHDSAVGAGGHFVIEFQNEVLEWLLVNDVAGRAVHAAERAVDHFPPGRDLLLPEIPPALGRRAVEQQLPAVGLLLIGELIQVRQDRGRLVVGRQTARARKQQRQSRQQDP